MIQEQARTCNLCERPVHARGFCSTHSKRVQRGAEVAAPITHRGGARPTAHNTFNVELSDADTAELLIACRECGITRPADFIRQCAEATIADRRMARLMADKDAAEESELREIAREITHKADSIIQRGVQAVN